MRGKIHLFIICWLWVLYLAPNVFSQHADIDILKSINSRESTFGDHSYTLLSASASPMAIGMPIAHLAIAVIKKDSALRQKSYVMGVSTASAMLLSTALKYTIERERPYETYPEIQNKATDFTPSFPSGHTTSAFATATSLSLAWPRWYVILPSYAWATGVGYSRLYLGAHYPSDVLVGAILGCGTSYLTWKVNRWLRKQ